MAARAVAAARRSPQLSGFLFILCIFVSLLLRYAGAHMQYSKTELLAVLNHKNLHTFADNDWDSIPPEIRRVTDSNFTIPPLKWCRRRRHRKQKRGERAGLKARLRANPHRPAIPSLVLTNSRSLNNKMSFLITDTKCKMSKGIVSDQERKKMKRKGDRYSMQTSLIVATLKRLLPVGLNICAPGEQELIALAKNRFTQKDTEDEVREVIRNNLHLQGKSEDPAIRWQMALYRDLPNHYEDTTDPEKTVERILDIGHVLFHLEQVEHPQRSKKAVWHKLLSKQRKRAVVACFRMAPLYNLPRHRAVNLFLQGYEKSWIETEEHYFEDKLIEDLAKPGEQEPSEEEEGQKHKHIDPLHQLIQLFSRTALTEKCKLDEDNLYMAYADIMAKSCHDEEDDDGEVKSFEEKEMEKQKLLYQQARLHDRGAAEMVLQTISASKDIPPHTQAVLAHRQSGSSTLSGSW